MIKTNNSERVSCRIQELSCKTCKRVFRERCIAFKRGQIIKIERRNKKETKQNKLILFLKRWFV